MARNGFRGDWDAPRKGGWVAPAVLEEFGGAVTLIPGKHRHTDNSGGSDPPRHRRAPTPAAAPPRHPLPRTPGSMLPPGQRRAPSPLPGTSRTRRGRRRGRLAGWPPPYLSTQGLRARLRPHRRPTPKTLPVPPRPAQPAWAARRVARPL